jgi:Cys-tRNA(Pro)/Cys-tRNA(Cys) deacylase
MTKTNAVRLLEREGISFGLKSYDVDERDLSAERAAEKLGMAPETVFKSIVALGDRRGPVFALVPAGAELVPRLLAEASGDKRIEVAPLKEVLGLTGYVRGAVTPLAAKRPYPVFIDETATLWPQIGVSGGRRGLEIIIAPDDLVRVTAASIADIARPR